MHYAILGNGVAGMEAALTLRARDADARVTIVSEEHDHFFSRPALMYVFAGQLSLRDTEPYDRGLYDRMGFERLRRRAVTLDAPGRALQLEGGERLLYDKLLLAAGSVARPAPWPGAAGPGIHSFVTLRDLEGLDRAARSGKRVIVVGGGLIGVEVAEVLRDRGLHVTFVVRENWYFPVALDRAEAALIAEHMGAHGIEVRFGVSVESIVRDEEGGLRGVRLGPSPNSLSAADDVVPADFVVAAIGVVPNTAFLANSSVAVAASGAVEVDDTLRTSAPDVWAAGDCANVTWADGSRRPEQLWYTARDQGRIAGRAMLGDDVVYRRGAWYNSAKFFDVEYTTAGWVPSLIDFDNRPRDLAPEVSCWFQRVPGRIESQRIVLKGKRVVGFNMLGSRWNHEVLLSYIDERRTLDWVLGHLEAARFDEEFSSPFRVQASATPR